MKTGFFLELSPKSEKQSCIDLCWDSLLAPRHISNQSYFPCPLAFPSCRDESPYHVLSWMYHHNWRHVGVFLWICGNETRLKSVVRYLHTLFGPDYLRVCVNPSCKMYHRGSFWQNSWYCAQHSQVTCDLEWKDNSLHVYKTMPSLGRVEINTAQNALFCAVEDLFK